MIRLFKIFILSLSFTFSSQLFAKIIQSISGDLPADLSENYFSITINLQPPDVALETLDQNNVFDRVQVKVQSSNLGWDQNAVNADFYLDSTAQIQAGSGTNSILVTYTIHGTKVGKLSSLATSGQITVGVVLYNNAKNELESTFNSMTTLKQFPYVPSEAPTGLSVKSKNQKLALSYTQKSSISYTESQSRDAALAKVMVYYVPRKAAAVTFDAKIYNTSGTYTTASKVCTIDFNQASGSNCVSCNTDNNYILPDDMGAQVDGMITQGPYVINGNVDVTGLSNDTEYTVFLSYQKGVARRSRGVLKNRSKN